MWKSNTNKNWTDLVSSLQTMILGVEAKKKTYKILDWKVKVKCLRKFDLGCTWQQKQYDFSNFRSTARFDKRKTNNTSNSKRGKSKFVPNVWICVCVHPNFIGFHYRAISRNLYTLTLWKKQKERKKKNWKCFFNLIYISR